MIFQSSNLKLNWSNPLLRLSLVLSLSFYAAPALAQAKLEPQPLFDQCSTLAEGAPSESIKQALLALNDKAAQRRIEAARQLGKACQRQAVEPLIALLKNEDPLARVAAVEALGQLGAKEAVEDLCLQTSDQDWRVRMALVRALSSFKTFQARNNLLNSLANPGDAAISDENDLRVRCIAILTLNQLSDVTYSRKALLFVYNFLQSPHERLRKLAEQTMVALKETRNAPIELVAILKSNNNPELRRWAAVWLGQLGIERGRSELENAAANDAHPLVKKAAAEALTHLQNAAK